MKQVSNQVSNTAMALIIAVGAAGFLGGMKFENYQTAKNRNQMIGQFQGQRIVGQQGGIRGGNRTMMGGNRPVAGEILSIDEKSLTIKMIDGSSKIVILSDKTSINKAAEATKMDLKTGERVSVFGTENADGSVTAANIQLNPMFRGISGTPAQK